jgi:hypothetical protein
MCQYIDNNHKKTIASIYPCRKKTYINLKNDCYMDPHHSIFHFSMHEKDSATDSHLQEWLLFLVVVYYITFAPDRAKMRIMVHPVTEQVEL